MTISVNRRRRSRVIGRNWPDATTGPYFDVSNSDPTTIIDDAGSSVTLPNGTLVVVGDRVEYTPKANFNGADWFEYVITDSDGDAATGRVDITVTPQPDAPRSFANPEYTVDQGSFLNILAAGGIASYAVDDDGDPMEVRLISVPSHHVPGGFTLDPSGNGAFTYTPDPAYGGNPGDTDTFQIYYWDENDNLASPPVTVTINFDPDEGVVAGPPPGEVEFDFDLADVPLEDAISAEANVLIMMDDSGSMDWSVMTPDDQGEFFISNSKVREAGVGNSTRTFRYVHELSTNIYGGGRRRADRRDTGRGQPVRRKRLRCMAGPECQLQLHLLQPDDPLRSLDRARPQRPGVRRRRSDECTTRPLRCDGSHHRSDGAAYLHVIQRARGPNHKANRHEQQRLLSFLL